MAEKQADIKEIKIGGYIMIDGEPCKVTKLSKGKAGKHGSAKVRLEAVGLFDEKKRSLLKPRGSGVSVPIIEKLGCQVISVSGEIAQVMDLTDYQTFDAKIPAELKGKLDPGKEIGYWKFGNKVLLKG